MFENTNILKIISFLEIEFKAFDMGKSKLLKNCTLR